MKWNSVSSSTDKSNSSQVLYKNLLRVSEISNFTINFRFLAEKCNHFWLIWLRKVHIRTLCMTQYTICHCNNFLSYPVKARKGKKYLLSISRCSLRLCEGLFMLIWLRIVRETRKPTYTFNQNGAFIFDLQHNLWWFGYYFHKL